MRKSDRCISSCFVVSQDASNEVSPCSLMSCSFRAACDGPCARSVAAACSVGLWVTLRDLNLNLNLRTAVCAACTVLRSSLAVAENVSHESQYRLLSTTFRQNPPYTPSVSLLCTVRKESLLQKICFGGSDCHRLQKERGIWFLLCYSLGFLSFGA